MRPTKEMQMPKTVRVFSPAKVNLHLEIGRRRPDGYHDAYSIMHALTLHDIVTMSLGEAPEASGLAVETSATCLGGVEALDVATEDNIATKAVRALAREFGRAADEKLVIAIEKRIPHAAGLGGGSSNAAAALMGACALWGLPSADARVERVAASLGADVPFFLRGGCVALSGRGDAFDHELVPMRRGLVVVRPDAGVSTAEAYRAFDEAADAGAAEEEAASASGPGMQTKASMDDASSGTRDGSGLRLGVQAAYVTNAADVALFNNLAQASERVLPELSEIRAWLAAQPGVGISATGAPEVLLSGSGSATFAMVDDIASALAIVSAAKLKGWWARSCACSSAGVRVMPEERSSNLGAQKRAW